MPFHREARLALYQGREFSQRTEHEIYNATAPMTMNMVMVLSAIPDLVAGLSFLELHLCDQSQLFQHGQGPIDRDQVSGPLLTLEMLMHLRCTERILGTFKNMEDRLARTS